MGGLLINPMEQPMNALLRLLETERRKKFDVLDLQGQEQQNELNKIRLNDVRGDVADEEQLRGQLQSNARLQNDPRAVSIEANPEIGAPAVNKPGKSPIRLQLEFLSQDPRRRDKFIALQNALINELQQLEQVNPDAAAKKWEEYFGVSVSDVGKRSDFMQINPENDLFDIRNRKVIPGRAKQEKLGPGDVIVEGGKVIASNPREAKEPSSIVGLFSQNPEQARTYLEMDAKIKSKYKLDRNPSVAEFMTNLYKTDPTTFDAVFNRNTAGKDEDRALKIVQLAMADQFSDDPIEVRVQKITDVLKGGGAVATPVGSGPQPIATESGGGPVNVISPQGVRGTIPKANLQKALAKGYKLANE